MNLARKFLASLITAALALAAAAGAPAKKEARVTQIVRDVKLLPDEAAPRAAAVNDQVSEGEAVRTGDRSRSELTFADLTISRLGANTIFSFNKAGRDVRLSSGSMLLRVPKNSGGAGILTAPVTVAITGTTVIFEATRAGRTKLIVLEGGARLSLVKNRGQSRELRAGQMLDVPAGATTLSAPVRVDLNQIMKTHPLITDFPPLPSRDLIVAAARDQGGPGPGGEPLYQGQPVAGQPRGPGFRLPPVLFPNPRSPRNPKDTRRPPRQKKPPKDRPDDEG